MSREKFLEEVKSLVEMDADNEIDVALEFTGAWLGVAPAGARDPAYADLRRLEGDASPAPGEAVYFVLDYSVPGNGPDGDALESCSFVPYVGPMEDPHANAAISELRQALLEDIRDNPDCG